MQEWELLEGLLRLAKILKGGTMSIRGKTQELYIQKTGIMIRDWFYNKKTIPYEKISKAEYCFPSGIEGGWIDFIEYTEKRHRFCFPRSSKDAINRAISYIRSHAPEVQLIEKSPCSYRFYYHKWFILLITWLFCAPIGLILLWCSPLQRKAFKVGLTVLWLSFFTGYLISGIIAFNQTVDFISSLFDPSTYIDRSADTNNEPSDSPETAIAEKSTNLFTDTLTAGHYTVGVDIPSGTYNFFAKSGFGNIISESLAINEIFDYDTIIGEIAPDITEKEISNVYLADDDVLTITGTLEVSVGSDDAGVTVAREQDLQEIELEYGIYAAGDDFPPGTYNIVWEEGFGSIQTDPYDIYSGINEVFGEKFGEKGSLTNEINKQIYGDDEENYIDYSGVYDDINEIMTIAEFKNVTLNENVLLKIEDLKVKLVPSP